MNETGRITIPAAIRREMRLEGEAELEVESVGDGEAIVLRPVVMVPRRDGWVYTAEDLEGIERGLRDLREGRERRATEADFRSLAEVADD